MHLEWLLAFKEEFKKLPQGAKIAVGGMFLLVIAVALYEHSKAKNSAPSDATIAGTPPTDPNALPQGVGGLSALDTNSLANMIAGLVNTQGKTGDTGPTGPAGAPAPPPPTTHVPVPPPVVHPGPIGHPLPSPQPLVRYTVKSGDNLSAISYRLHTPGGWQNLYNLNKGVIGSNPNLIKPGQVLVLPR